MMATIKTLIIICLVHIILMTTCAFGQKKSFPEIGKMMPAFALKADQRKKEEAYSSESLRGKYYILDFWSTGCGACVASFPKTDSLQSRFNDRIQIILVGLEEQNRDVRKFYEVYKRRSNLNLSVAFDSAAFNKFVPSGVPHLIWVNREGTVAAITTTVDLNEKNLESFLSGKDFAFEDVSNKMLSLARTNSYDPRSTRSTVISENDAQGSFASDISLWNPQRGMPSFPDPYILKQNYSAKYQITAASATVLYSLAYFGTTSVRKNLTDTYPVPIISSNIQASIENRFGKNARFCYVAQLPNEMASKEILMKKMQNDISMYFGTSAKIAKKEIEVFSLRVIDESKFSKIKSREGKSSETWFQEIEVQKFVNVPISHVLELLTSKVQPRQIYYVINETGYNGKITLNLKAKIIEMNSIREGLKKAGLDLVPNVKDLNVLEISEDHQ